MKQLKDKYAGHTCIVIGNGPSLRAVPLVFLNKYISFGTNKIFKLSDFVPTYYVSVDNTILSCNGAQIQQMRSQLVFIPADFKMKGTNIVTFRHEPGRRFCTDPTTGLYGGWTVTFVALQLAYWMGFTTVLLVGVDHYYEYPADTFCGFEIKKLVSNGCDKNHFTPDYHEPGEEYMAATDLRRMEDSYVMARQAFEDDGRRIINLTYDTHLDVFEKDKLWHWM